MKEIDLIGKRYFHCNHPAIQAGFYFMHTESNPGINNDLRLNKPFVVRVTSGYNRGT